ncbi:MAG: creatininase family protein [Anaerolineae bacterium]|nr:creatininase family protein [Anaerolineae bacterium]
MLSWENTWRDLEESGTTIAVLPVGATEQHGTNLPLMTDSLIATRVGEAIADAFHAYLLPTIPVGMSATHLSFRGTLSLRRETLAAVVTDLVDSLAQTGFTTVIIVSTHGGNYVLYSDFVDELRRRHPHMTIVVLRPRRAGQVAREAAGIHSEEWHAGEGEASLVASLRPDLVGPEPTDFPHPRSRIRDVPVTPETGFPQDVRQVSPMGSLGEPSLGTKEKGDRYWQVYLPLMIEDLRRELGL